jgi:hypothetical protein
MELNEASIYDLFKECYDLTNEFNENLQKTLYS